MKCINLQKIILMEENAEEGVFYPKRIEMDSVGKYGVRISSKSDNDNNTVVFPGGHLKKSLPLGMKPGQEYTFVSSITLKKPLKGVLNNDSLSISFVPVTNNGEVLWSIDHKTYGMNETGQQYLVHHVKVPENAIGGFLRLNSGMFKNNGEVVWDFLTMFEGNQPIDSLFSSKYGDSIQFDGETVVLNKKIAQYFATDLNKDLSLITDNTFTSIKKELAVLTDINSKDYFKSIQVANINKDYSLTKKLIVEATDEELPMFGYNRENFVKNQISFADKRYELLKWFNANYDQILAMSKGNESISTQGDLGDNPIFVFWAQGLENAPAIVQANIARMKSQFGDNLHILTDNNFRHYVDLSDDVNKIKSTHIAHWSDYLRVALLEKYGGTWIDSTVVIGTNLDQKLKEMSTKNSVVTPRYGNIEDSTGISNWFIYAEQPSLEIIRFSRAALRLWMHDHNSYHYYFHFHAIFDFVVSLNETAKLQWENSPAISAEEAHYLYRNRFNELSKERIDETLTTSLVQKMTYKFDRNNNERFTSDSVISKVIRYRDNA